MKKERVIKYKGQHLDIYFHVDRCNHFAACLSGAPEVFNLMRKPWIRPDAAAADKIIRVIEKCPTGALHYRRHDDGQEEMTPTENSGQITRHGPIYLRGNLEVLDENGEKIIEDTRLGLCRCGKSRHKPHCDGEHLYQGYLEAGKFPEGTPERQPELLPKGKLSITLSPSGPFKLSGPVTLKDAEGKIRFQGEKTALCSCGLTKNPPLCDGSHKALEVP